MDVHRGRAGRHVAGLGLFTFGYARGYSYLTNDPAACANCHIMREYHDAWTKGSHHVAATCNDCHTPHTPVGKYVVIEAEDSMGFLADQAPRILARSIDYARRGQLAPRGVRLPPVTDPSRVPTNRR